MQTVTTYLLISSLAAGSAAVLAQATPGAGSWELSMTMEGGPRAAAPRTGIVCLAADALAAAPEQTLIDAAARQGSGERAPPRCTLRDIRRDGAGTAWQAQCEGPMGAMQGVGTGTLGPESASLQQTFQVKAPVGSMTLKQTIGARRLGAC
jgi:Protein of unknown function (DUF3617)